MNRHHIPTTAESSWLERLIEARTLLLEAADYVEANAEALRKTHTVGGDWFIAEETDFDAMASYHGDLRFAAELRAAAKTLRTGEQP